ncbi:hypothetical protein FOA52_008361 [Chlamydomonas sp. UWO 241]|nr:hypothetical protein FOA52_008361 [Chlamydomonas sp. UWO 241]
MLTPHGRLQWYYPDADTATVLHEGGVRRALRHVSWQHWRGRRPGDRVGHVRPHNWRPDSTEEALLQLDADTGTEVSRSSIPSQFTHDAVRSGTEMVTAMPLSFHEPVQLFHLCYLCHLCHL